MTEKNDLDRFIADRTEENPDFPLIVEIARLRNCIKRALEYANHRWSEWGDRAMGVEEILEAGLNENE